MITGDQPIGVTMKVIRKIIQIDDEKCDGCGQCVPGCAEGALQIVDGKARMVAEKYCDGLGACLGECPNDALHVIEREAEEFDELAVEEYLAAQEKTGVPDGPKPSGTCPSAAIQIHSPAGACDKANIPAMHAGGGNSFLTHWPIQIRLIPPNAPFLKGADLLVVADCAALSYPQVQQVFVKGRVVMMGCPKFDAVQEYIDKFAQIFRLAGIKSITVLIMEVPCCSGLPGIVKKGLQAAEASIPMSVATISTKGELIELKNIG